MLDEVFVPIHDLYYVSNYGTVVNIQDEFELIRWADDAGRQKVWMIEGRDCVETYVDELVTEAFFVNYKPGIEIFYKNGNKEDCTVLNLTFDPKYRSEET